MNIFARFFGSGYGVAIGTISALLYTVMGLLIHLSPSEIPSGELLFFRAVLAIVALSFVLKSKIPSLFKREALPVWGRSFFGALSIICYYLSVRLTSFGNANLLSDLGALFVPLFSVLFLGARFQKLEIFGLVLVTVGLAGIHSPGFSPLSGTALIVGVCGAGIGAAAYLLLGSAAKRFKKSEIVFCQGVALLLCALVLPGAKWVVPSLGAFPYLFGAALLGLLAQLTLTESYKVLNASVATALTLTVCIWGVILESILKRSFPSLLEISVYSITLIGVYVFQYRSFKGPQITKEEERTAELAAIRAFDQVVISKERIQTQPRSTSSITVGIVDPEASGSYLKRILEEQGHIVLSIWTSEHRPSWYSEKVDPQDSRTLIYREHDELTLISELLKRKVAAIFPGTDLGVKLATRLANQIGLPDGASLLQEEIRDKAKQIEFLQKNSQVPVARSCLIDRAEDAILFQNQLGKWPVVVKPIAAGGSEGVSICHSESEINRAIEDILHKTNADLEINSQVLIQEFLDGPEYVVNAVCKFGHVVVTDAWKYHKREVTRSHGAKSMIREYNELLTHRGELSQEEQRILDENIQYSLDVIDAIQFKSGAIHLELIYTAEGPRLVEINARMAGARMSLDVDLAGGESQATVLAEAVTNPSAFLKRASMVKNSPAKITRMVRLISNQTGTIKELKFGEEIKKIPSYQRHHFFSPGTALLQTVDLDTCPGTILLANSDVAQLEADYHQVRELEKAGFFSIE